MKKKSLPITNIGTASLLTTFIILCMIVFAALSLASASANARLGQKAADHLTEYYAASNEAEELLALADHAFLDAYQNAGSTEEYYRLVRKELLLSPMQTVWTDEAFEVAFQVEINDTQALQVLLDVHSPQQMDEGAASFYRILSWQTISTNAWKNDDTLHLIQ